MSEELKQAWKEVLFWAKRLSYHSACKHPEWREKYGAAKKRRNELQQQEETLLEKGE